MDGEQLSDRVGKVELLAGWEVGLVDGAEGERDAALAFADGLEAGEDKERKEQDHHQLNDAVGDAQRLGE